MSIKVGKEPGAEDMCPPRKFVDPDFGTGRPLSTPRISTPEQQYNYKSKYARYLKALNLKPGSITSEAKCEVYTFHSCDAPSRAWTVKVCPSGGTFIEAGNPVTILCPPDNGYQLTQVESDGESFTWTQLSGSRTIIVEPLSNKNPRLFLQNTCSTSGCDDGSYLPVILQVSVDNNPELFDYLIVYTTPTETHYGVSAGVNINLPDSTPCRQIDKVHLAPLYVNKAYVNDGTNELLITWELPTCSLEYLVNTNISKNTTGNYSVLDVFGKSEERLFAVQPNVSYRIGSQFKTHGKTTAILGLPFRFSFGDSKLVLADESHFGISAHATATSQKITFKVTSKIAQDAYHGLSAIAATKSTYVSFRTKSITSVDLHKGLAATGKTKFSRVKLGGVTIG